jgi:hypothetical protein
MEAKKKDQKVLYIFATFHAKASLGQAVSSS